MHKTFTGLAASIATTVLLAGPAAAQEAPAGLELAQQAPAAGSPVPAPGSIPGTPADDTVALPPADREPTWRVGAFIQVQTGVFTGTQKDVEEDKSPVDHGGNLGDLSMARFTLQMDADWRPLQNVSLHATGRFARSLTLPADEEAQVPEPGYAGDSKEQRERRRDWVRDRYYNEIDLREFYVDWQAHPIFNLRVGRQLVAWGEAGNSRLLDVVNPVDSTWHFGGFESFEDQRTPMWMVRASLEIPALRGGLDAVWVPMLPLFEDAEDTVTVPLTFVGAWGLPTPPKQRDDSVSPRKIHAKYLDIPHKFGTDSRLGFRWKGNIGSNVSYSLMYYWTHQISPPMPAYTLRPWQGDASCTPGMPGCGPQSTFDVHLDFPRQHLVGFSLEGQVPYPIGTMLKLEALFEPDRKYAMNSAAFRTDVTPVGDDGFPKAGEDEKILFPRRTEFAMTYAVTLQQPFFIRAVNPEQPFILVAQFTHTFVPGVDDLDVDNAIVDVPGYDQTVVTKHQYRIVGALFTTFLHGLITPRVAAGWIPKEVRWDVEKRGEIENWTLKRQSASHGSGFASVSIAFNVMDSLRAVLAYNAFFGTEAYDGLGFYRDRDEVNLSVRYQF